MLLHFRQGIVEAQIPTFFRVTYPSVDLIVTDTNTTIAFAAGAKDYLFTEQVSVPNAWGPLHLGVDQWLYWDLDIRTGNRTFGITVREPVVSALAPSAPQMDQHWFDSTSNEMKVWSGNVWVKKIRTFAFKLAQGKIPVSMSANAPSFLGTQVGNTTDTYAGHILYDATTNNAIKNANGQFMTTEDKLSTKAISLSQVKVASIIVEGEAQQNLSAHTVVVFTEFGKIVHADQFVAEKPIQFGMIEQSAVVGQTVNVVTSGMVSSEAFDFTSLGVNALLYCSATGQLVSEPVVPKQTPVAVVIDRKTIQLGVALASSTDTIPTINLATNTVYGIARLSTPAEDAEDPVVVGDNDPRWNSFVRKAGDAMTGPLFLSGAPTQDLHAATKKYVDDSRTPAAGSNYQIQYNVGGNFTASDELSLSLPPDQYGTTTLTIGGHDHIRSSITTSSTSGYIQLEGGGRQDSQPGSAILQGGALFTSPGYIPPNGPGGVFGGHAMVIGGPGFGPMGRAGDAWIQGGTGQYINGRVIIDGGTNFDTNVSRSTAAGGSVQISGGKAQGATSTVNAGSVVISGGTAEGTGSAGNVEIQTAGVSRISYGPSGDWQIGDSHNAGTLGQVLTSRGPGQSPLWQDVSGGTGLADRIVNGAVMQRVVDTSNGDGTNTMTISDVPIIESTKQTTVFFDHSTPAWTNDAVFMGFGTPGSAQSCSVAKSSNRTYVIGNRWSGTEQPMIIAYNQAGNIVWTTAVVIPAPGGYIGHGQTISYDASNDRLICTVTYRNSNQNTALGVLVVDASDGTIMNSNMIADSVADVFQAKYNGNTLYICGSDIDTRPYIASVDPYSGTIYRFNSFAPIPTGVGVYTGLVFDFAFDTTAGDGSLYVVGEIGGTMNEPINGRFIAKLDINLNVVWVKIYTEPATESTRFICVTVVDNKVYVVGTHADFNGGTQGIHVLILDHTTGAIVNSQAHMLDNTYGADEFYIGSVAVDPATKDRMIVTYSTSYDPILRYEWAMMCISIPSGALEWVTHFKPATTYQYLGMGWDGAVSNISIDNSHTLAFTGWYSVTMGGVPA